MSEFSKISEEYRPALMISTVLLFFLLLVTARFFLLFTPRVFFLSLLIYWPVTVLLILFRPESARRFSLEVIRLGFLLLYATIYYLEPYIFGQD